MKQKLPIFLFLFLMMMAWIPETLQAKDKINLLLLSGKNNHEWQKTTPKLHENFTRSNLFSVTITERPDTPSESSLYPFQLIVSNRNSWPDKDCSWPATEKISQKVPDELSRDIPSRKLAWQKDKNSVTLLNNGKIVWQHHFDKAEGKPYFHPLSTMDGSVLTGLRPEDHPWHRAVWFSWKYINGLNYWEEDPKTGKSEGITELKSVKYELGKDFGAEFNMVLSYHPPTGSELLKEVRTIHLTAPAADGSYYMDWESTFTALADEVLLDRTPLPGEADGKSWGGYAGFSARLNLQLWDVKTINDSGETANLHGKASKWVTYGGKDLQSQPVSMTIFDHPTNPNHPNKWYISNDPAVPFYYFSPAPVFDRKLVMKKGDQLILKYRLLVSSGEINQEKIRSNWNQFKSK